MTSSVFPCMTSLSQERWPHAPPITVLSQIENPCMSLPSVLSSLLPTLEDLLGHTKFRLCLLDITWPWEPDFAVHPLFVMHGTVLFEIWPQTDDLVFRDKRARSIQRFQFGAFLLWPVDECRQDFLEWVSQVLQDA